MSCLHILEINPLSVVVLANIFSHSEGCLFTLFMVSFAMQKLLSLVRSHLFLVLFFITLGNESKKDLAVIFEKEYSVCIFLEEFYGVWSYIWVLHPFCLFLCMVLRSVIISFSYI